MPETINIRKKGLNNSGSVNTETKTIIIKILFLSGNKVCLNIQYNKKDEIGMPIAKIKYVKELELPLSVDIALNSKLVDSSKELRRLLLIKWEDLKSLKKLSSNPMPVKG